MLGFAKILLKIHLTNLRQWPTDCIQSIDLFNLDCNVLCYFLKCLNWSGFAERTTPNLNGFNHKYLFLAHKPVIGWGSAGFNGNPLASDRIYFVTICKKDGSRCSTCLLYVGLQKEPFLR